MNNDEIYLESINISRSKLNYAVFYYANCSSKSNVTFCTFYNNSANASPGYYQARHFAISNLIEFEIHFCNYLENTCNSFISSSLHLYILNCSFNKNNFKQNYFLNDQYVLLFLYISLKQNTSRKMLGHIITIIFCIMKSSSSKYTAFHSKDSM